MVQDNTAAMQSGDALTLQGLAENLGNNVPHLNNPVVKGLINNEIVQDSVAPLGQAAAPHLEQLNEKAAPLLQTVEKVGNFISSAVDVISSPITWAIAKLPESVQHFALNAVNKFPLIPGFIKNPIVANIRENLQEANASAETAQPEASQTSSTQEQQTTASEHDVPVTEPVSPAPTPTVEQASTPEQGQVRG